MRDKDNTTVFITIEEGGEWFALDLHSIMLPNGLVYDSYYFRNPEESDRVNSMSLKKAKVFRKSAKGSDPIEYESNFDALRRGKVKLFRDYNPTKMKEWIRQWLKEGSKTG